MAHGNTLHAEAVKSYQQRGQLSQKDLLARMGFNSVRSIQRIRVRYGLTPVGWWGINPLFDISDVERIEKLIAKERAEKMCSKMKHARSFRLVSINQARRRAGRKARK
jgi:hypothetical protein